MSINDSLTRFKVDVYLIFLDFTHAFCRFEKLFLSVDSAQPNYSNICTALDTLTYLLSILKKETILASLKPLQRSLAACMNCTNTKV